MIYCFSYKSKPSASKQENAFLGKPFFPRPSAQNPVNAMS